MYCTKILDLVNFCIVSFFFLFLSLFFVFLKLDSNKSFIKISFINFTKVIQSKTGDDDIRKTWLNQFCRHYPPSSFQCSSNAHSMGFLAELTITFNITWTFDLHESNFLIHVGVSEYLGPPILEVWYIFIFIRYTFVCWICKYFSAKCRSQPTAIYI